MNELLRALRVAQTSTRRFRTLRATMRDWWLEVAFDEELSDELFEVPS